MPKWIFAALVLLQLHFVASFLVPLDSQAQGEFGGLLKWVWPWSDGDSGPLGQVTAAEGVPFVGLVIAMAAGLTLVMTILAVFGIWVPTGWWRALTIAGGALSILLMVLFFGFTKVLPIAVAGAMIWYTISVATSEHWATAAAD